METVNIPIDQWSSSGWLGHKVLNVVVNKVASLYHGQFTCNATVIGSLHLHKLLCRHVCEVCPNNQ